MPRQPKAVVLAGGMGTRLQPYTFFVPKPMLPLGDKPLLEHLLLWLKKNSVSEFVFSIGYLGKTIESYFENGSQWAVKISYAHSNSALGISGQLLNSRDYVKSTFYLLYGDSIFDFDIRKILQHHKKSKSVLTMGLMHFSQKLAYGMIERGNDGTVTAWKEKPEVQGLINVGCYVAEPKLFDYIPKGRMYGFDSVVRDMIKAGERVSSYVIPGKEFLDIGDERSYKRVYDLFLQKMGKVL
ncbi:MAG: nucleotidyltransferase family protein [Nitrososphaerales archaeon]